MTTRGTPSATRRVLRVSSRASSEDATAHSAPSARKSRSSRLDQTGTPAKQKQVGRSAPRVTNKQSRAYGAEGKPDYAQQISAALALDEAANPIQMAVEGAEAVSPNADRVASSLVQDEAEDESEEASAGRSRLDIVEEDSAEHTTWLNRSGWLDFSTWAPRERYRDRQPAQAGAVPSELDESYWETWEAEDRNKTGGSIRQPLNWAFYLACICIVLTSVSLLDIYKGPLLGPHRDFLLSRLSSPSSPNNSDSMPWQHTMDVLNARFTQVESLVASIASKATFSKTVSSSAANAKVNWFAAGNGAVVDPRLTSPTEITCEGESWWTLLNLLGSTRCRPSSDPPAQALCPWSEPDERWCAPPSDGKLQLTVITPRQVAPTALVVEHIPKSAAISIGDAPREVELWVDIQDNTVFDAVARFLKESQPDLLKFASPMDLSSNELPDTFLPVGRWEYNIYDSSHIQTFRISPPVQELGVKANRFSIRVNSNWGAHSPTCIYRVRLEGEDVSGRKEKKIQYA